MRINRTKLAVTVMALLSLAPFATATVSANHVKSYRYKTVRVHKRTRHHKQIRRRSHKHVSRAYQYGRMAGYRSKLSRHNIPTISRYAHNREFRREFTHADYRYTDATKASNRRNLRILSGYNHRNANYKYGWLGANNLKRPIRRLARNKAYKSGFRDGIYYSLGQHAKAARSSYVGFMATGKVTD